MPAKQREKILTMQPQPNGSITNSASERVSIDIDMEKSSDQAKDTDMTEKDPEIVDFDGPDDPESPENWSSSRKVTAIVIVTAMTLLSYVSIPPSFSSPTNTSVQLVPSVQQSPPPQH
jgi:hypothetical protein